jgi:SAM-dependent methyltransferase
MNSGWQLSGDAPLAYVRFALKIMEPWTDDLIRSAGCRDGDRVLDVACGTGVVANRVNLVSGKLCMVTGIDANEGMLSVARRNPQIEWHQGSATDLPFEPGSFEVVLCQRPPILPRSRCGNEGDDAGSLARRPSCSQRVGRA